MNRNLCLTLAALSATLLAGCEADDSLPTRPRTALPFSDSKSQQNAEMRALEKPDRTVPTGSGKELPGQSSAAPIGDRSVLTLDAAPAQAGTSSPISGFTGPSGKEAFGHTQGPITIYTRDAYKGPMPNLPPNPGTVPTPGSLTAADGDWTISNSWGQGLTLENYPHRPWTDTTAFYHGVEVKHNPVYYFNLRDHTDISVPPGPRTADVASTVIEAPWFFLNTLALPVLMLLEPPFALRSTERASQDPVFKGALPAAGPIVPAPVPGTLHWDYPFLKPDGTVKTSRELADEARAASQPATRP